jgi:AraC family transcriptional regulator of adaptative response / DNA-3-methyladenine glycosylase II
MSKRQFYYQAMLARDHRFDGTFFVGVKTTGVYCRPICSARPKLENVVFYTTAPGAERVGFRPCLRCRPEAAPGSPAWAGTSSTVQRALRILTEAEAANLSVDEDTFAERFGVSARHLRRLFQEEVGQTPKQIGFIMKLNFARQLVVETKLPIAQISEASG